MPTGRARNISSIVNRTNNCGGIKKAGLAPRTGGNALVMRNIATQAVNTIPTIKCGSGGRGCPRNFSDNPGGQACGGVGRMAQLATRGIAASAPTSTVPADPIPITLATALTQNGVAANQNLVLQQNDYDTDNNGNVVGLRIRTGQTFTVAGGGAITFADPVVSINGDVTGINVESGATFIIEGNSYNLADDDTDPLSNDDIQITIHASDFGTTDGMFIESGGTLIQNGGSLIVNVILRSDDELVAERSARSADVLQGRQDDIAHRHLIEPAHGLIIYPIRIEGVVRMIAGRFDAVYNYRGGFNPNPNDNEHHYRIAHTVRSVASIVIRPGADFRMEGGLIRTGFFNIQDFVAESVAGIDNQGNFSQTGGTIRMSANFVSNLGQVAGINNNGTFTQQGGTIAFTGVIDGISNAFGFVNNEGGIFRQRGGTIRFKSINSPNNSAGIINVSGTFEQHAGAFIFEGAISSMYATAHGILNSDAGSTNLTPGSFWQDGGTITFEGNIKGHRAIGILNTENEGFLQGANGVITFQGLLQQKRSPIGVLLINSEATLFTTNGIIQFPGNSGTYAAGNFNPPSNDPGTNSQVNGNGRITYNNEMNLYYAAHTTVNFTTALAQGGVRVNQHLILRESDYIRNNGNVFGLQIDANQTFTIDLGGSITFADPITGNGTVRGINNNGTLNINGGSITFSGDIRSNNNDAHGIYNEQGIITQTSGAITFEGSIVGQGFMTTGIFNSNANITLAGTVTFEGDITHNTSCNGIFNSANGTFTQESGAIIFQNPLQSTTNICRGISNIAGTFIQETGAIIFQAGMESGNSTIGIQNNTGTFRQRQASAEITFQGLLKQNGSVDSVLLLSTDFQVGGGMHEVNGTIRFPGSGNDLYTRFSFFPNHSPGNSDNRLTGNGIITYNNGPDMYYPPRNTMSLAVAVAQGGLQPFNHLFLQETDYIQNNGNVFGLRIEPGQTFTVAANTNITFADPIISTTVGGESVGIQVDNGGTFIQQGCNITFKEGITSNSFATGIRNNTGGTFRQESGTITFERVISSINNYGIFTGGTFNQAGTITFKNDITTNNGSSTGIRNIDGAFTQQGGTITFQGEIRSTNDDAIGIRTAALFTQEAGGTITFEREIIVTGNNNGDAIGIVNNSQFTPAGAITFEGNIATNHGNATGIETTGLFTQEGGTITFEHDIMSSTTTRGISNTSTFLQQAGAITFKGYLDSGNTTDGIFNDNLGPQFQMSQFAQNHNGTITFEGPMRGISMTRGIINNAQFDQDGTITFERDIRSNDNASGIVNNNPGIMRQLTNGVIGFRGLFILSANTGIIRLIESSANFEVNGSVEFAGDILRVYNVHNRLPGINNNNFIPNNQTPVDSPSSAPSPPFSGNGRILYNIGVRPFRFYVFYGTTPSRFYPNPPPLFQSPGDNPLPSAEFYTPAPVPN